LQCALSTYQFSRDLHRSNPVFFYVPTKVLNPPKPQHMPRPRSRRPSRPARGQRKKLSPKRSSKKKSMRRFRATGGLQVGDYMVQDNQFYVITHVISGEPTLRHETYIPQSVTEVWEPRDGYYARIPAPRAETSRTNQSSSNATRRPPPLARQPAMIYVPPGGHDLYPDLREGWHPEPPPGWNNNPPSS